MKMNYETFNKKLENKEAALKKIKNSKYPTNSDKEFRHEERVHNAIQFLDELDSLIMATDKPICIVSKSTFTKIVDKVDFASIESDGIFHQLALIGSYPEDPYYLVWLAPLSEI